MHIYLNLNIGSLVAALKIYYESRRKRKEKSRSKIKASNSSTNAGKTPNRLLKSVSVNSELSRQSSVSKTTKARTERSILLETTSNQEDFNLPAEELLELGWYQIRFKMSYVWFILILLKRFKLFESGDQVMGNGFGFNRIGRLYAISNISLTGRWISVEIPKSIIF